MEALNKKTVEDIDVNGKKVLVRCDFNVPLKDGVITSDKRIVASLPTIKYLIDHNAKVILCSHLGRPKGEFKPEFSLAPVAARLTELLGKEVKMAKDVVGESAQSLAASLQDGDVMLLENVRFHKEETKNDPEFSKKLASVQHTEHTPPQQALQHTAPQSAASSFRRKSNSSAVPLLTRSVRLLLFSAVPKYLTRSALLQTSSTSVIQSSSAAVWLTHS